MTLGLMPLDLTLCGGADDQNMAAAVRDAHEAWRRRQQAGALVVRFMAAPPNNTEDFPNRPEEAA